MLKNKNIILLHAFFWLLVLFDVLFVSNWLAQQNQSYLFAGNKLNVHPVLYHVITHAPDVLLTAGFFYLHLLWLVPWFFKQKRYIAYAIATVLSIALLYLPLRYGIEEWFFKSIGGTGLDFTNKLFWITDSIAYIFRYCFIAVAYYLTWRWAMNEKEKEQLKTEKLTTELSFLKNQLNPHFLFNTLSNIHSLAYTQSKETPAAILKLSDMMRYMLYDSNETEVSLDDEIEYLQNFMEFQKMRTEKPVYVEVSFNIIETGKKIAPLLLIPFVENIFKHGNLHDPDRPATISLNCTAAGLVFHTRNAKSLGNKDNSSGIGIANMKRRLDLLYAGHHQLSITGEKDIFETELTISFNHVPIFQ
jgi:two-component system LytT family sensor kinase